MSEEPKKAKLWTRCGENLVRHRSGTIYLNAKVRGKKKRVSLETSELRIAKLKRDDRLEALRAAQVPDETKVPVRTLGDAINVTEKRLTNQPDLKPDTISYYRAIVKILRATMPETMHARQWTATEAAAWWMDIANKYAAQRANNTLLVCKQVLQVVIEAGLRLDDPTAKLKRMKVEQKDRWIPSPEEMAAIIEDIRSQKKRSSEKSANYVAFLAYAGPRHGQTKESAFERQHIESSMVDSDEGPKLQETWLRFPSGTRGSKGAKTRRLPINPPLRAVLDRMKPYPETGSLFGIISPRIALANACKRLGLPHLRLHDLRHFFTVFAIEAGVDIPTVAAWLGHKDGGKLLLETYNHLRDGHSLASAAKMGASKH